MHSAIYVYEYFVPVLYNLTVTSHHYHYQINNFQNRILHHFHTEYCTSRGQYIVSCCFCMNTFVMYNRPCTDISPSR